MESVDLHKDENKMEERSQQQIMLVDEIGEGKEMKNEKFHDDDNQSVQLCFPRNEEDANKIEASAATTSKTTNETTPAEENNSVVMRNNKNDSVIMTSNNNNNKDNTIAAAASWSSPSSASAAGTYEARLRRKMRAETNQHKNSISYTTTVTENVPVSTQTNKNNVTSLSKSSTSEESYGVKFRRKMMEETMKGGCKPTALDNTVKSMVVDDMTSENNGSITSTNGNDVSSSSSPPSSTDEESHIARIRHKVKTERNHQAEAENKRQGDPINAARSVPDKIMSSAIGDEAGIESRDNEVTPGAFAASGRAIGGMPAWARRASALIHHRSDGPSLPSQEAERGEDRIELEAIVVDKEQEEKEMKEVIRRELVKEVVTADSVEKVESPQKRRIRKIICVVLAIAAVVVITALLVALTKKNDDDHPEEYSTPLPTPIPDPVLKQIAETGVLKCYVVNPYDIAFCRALSAAIFGPVDLEQKMYLLDQQKDWQTVERFAALANGTVDVIFGAPHTMERDFQKDRNSEVGFTFTAPYLYDGLTFYGSPEFVECAEELDTFGNCSDLRICVIQGVENYNFLDVRLPNLAIVPVISFDDMINGLTSGRCNVIGEIYTLILAAAIQIGGHDDFTMGSKMHTKVPLSFVTRDNDPGWSDFVNSVVQSFWAAYTMNVTKDTADKFRTTSLYGDEFENMFIDAIGEAGNAKEGLDRHSLTLQPDINQINRNGSTGLIYSLPFGDTQKEGPGPIPGGKLEKILKRGKLLCGIIPNRQGFAHYNTAKQRYSGLDVDYCHAIASGIFRSDRTAVDFVPFDVNNTSNTFEALVNGTIDIAAGVEYTLERDVREPFTGEGFSFSTPYFYDPPEGPLKEALSLATCQDDPQWSSVVYWIVMATFYAEENNWTHDLSYLMPLVDLLGPYEGHGFRRIFRDAIMVGNYGQLYKRNVEKIVPRSGRNRLNKDPLGPQLNPYMYFSIS